MDYELYIVIDNKEVLFDSGSLEYLRHRAYLHSKEYKHLYNCKYLKFVVRVWNRVIEEFEF